MIEALDVVLGGLLVWAAFRAGERREKRRQPADPQPVCGCTHHYSMHDGGGCHDTVWGDVSGRKVVRCPCKHYVGPEPLPQILP